MVLNKDFVSYLRVSTARQGSTGYGLDAQRQAVHDFIAYREGRLNAEFVEVESGKARNRPKLESAIRQAQKENATLLIAKLDRLARNVHVISGLMESNVDFVAVDMPDANKLTIHIFAAMAEYERDAISQRTKAGLAAAKARGVRLGSPTAKKTIKLARKAASDKANAFASEIMFRIKEIRRAGVTTYAGIAEALNHRGIKTARGGVWYPTSVKRLLERVE
ncbi:MAG: recombinase family protein [Desulfarculaceae bacterium]|nr:recombinase family protein [Desulfarculaceae bacterium]MCF8122677.1 recombinase family protein [Desulfarculaceae bacterium]